MAFRVDTSTGRAKLKPRREPYWARVEAGGFVGYRKLDEGAGTWIARWRDGGGKQHYRALGRFEDRDTGAKAFDGAVKAAREWFKQCDTATPKRVSVAQVCKSYVEDRRAHKGESTAKDAEGRFNRHVYDAQFGQIELAKLRADDIAKWQRGLVRTDDDDADAERRSKDSANRDLAALEAALNFGFQSGLVGTDAAWRRVESFKDVARRRERFLTLVQRKRLFAAASPESKRLTKAIALTACGPGEIVAATVGDSDARSASLSVQGKTGRTIPLSPDAVKFFKGCAQNRAGKPITRAMAEQRMLETLTRSLTEDVAPMLPAGVRWSDADAIQAFERVWAELIARISEDRWKLSVAVIEELRAKRYPELLTPRNRKRPQ
jgi:hypothetical protein